MQCSWVSSPLGTHILLALLRKYNAAKYKKYLQIEALLKNKKQYGSNTQIFCSNLDDVKSSIRHTQNVKTTEMKDWKESIKKIGNSLDSKPLLNEFLKTHLTETKFVLTNLTTYEDKWNKSEKSNSAIMKVYNSFNYTEDIKYEARLLELPMQDNDFKLVVIVPNECDVLNNLVNKLYSEGLTAAAASIQPLFTSVCSLNAPFIQFNSQVSLVEEIIDDSLTINIAEIGNVKIDNEGVAIKVLTYIFPKSNQTQVNKRLCEKTKNSFHFSLLYKDNSIFNGKYDIKMVV